MYYKYVTGLPTRKTAEATRHRPTSPLTEGVKNQAVWAHVWNVWKRFSVDQTSGRCGQQHFLHPVYLHWHAEILRSCLSDLKIASRDFQSEKKRRRRNVISVTRLNQITVYTKATKSPRSLCSQSLVESKTAEGVPQQCLTESMHVGNEPFWPTFHCVGTEWSCDLIACCECNLPADIFVWITAIAAWGCM